MKTFLLILLICCVANITFARDYSFDTSFIHNKQKITVKVRELKNEAILLTAFCNAKKVLSDTLDKGGFANLEYVDFNKDKSKDILLTYSGNNPTYFLYLFDLKTNTFRSVKGFDRFPEAVQLRSDHRYYYSYHRAGCADLNWVSDLFIIDDFKAIQKGHIYGQGCEFDIKSNPQQIEICKISHNNEANKKVIAILPMRKYVPNFEDKWDFIEKYWNKNYLKFR